MRDDTGRDDPVRADTVRQQLADWVRPVASAPIPDIRALRRRARRRGIRRAATVTTIALVAAAVVTAVAVAGVTGGVAGKGRPEVGRPAASRSAAPGMVTHGAWQPAGPLPAADAAPAVQPYIVLLPVGDGTAKVRNVFTFHTVATIAPLPGQFMINIAAAGDDRTFVIEAEVGGQRQEFHGKKIGPPMNSRTVVFDELRLNADYRPISLVELFTVPANDVESVFAISQDASMLAYSTGNGFETVSLATGTRRSWPGVDGGAASIGTMAWAGDRHLVFEWTSNSANSVQPADAGTRLLDVTARGDVLQASRLIVPFGQHCSSRAIWCDPPAITADGAKLLITKAITTGGDTTGTVEEVSVSTGQVLAIVATPVTQPTPGPNCLPLWSDPSGAQMVLSCAHSQKYDDGHISPITTRQPMNGTDFGTFAW